jgi:hypothetical protein
MHAQSGIPDDLANCLASILRDNNHRFTVLYGHRCYAYDYTLSPNLAQAESMFVGKEWQTGVVLWARKILAGEAQVHENRNRLRVREAVRDPSCRSRCSLCQDDGQALAMLVSVVRMTSKKDLRRMTHVWAQVAMRDRASPPAWGLGD